MNNYLLHIRVKPKYLKYNKIFNFNVTRVVINYLRFRVYSREANSFTKIFSFFFFQKTLLQLVKMVYNIDKNDAIKICGFFARWNYKSKCFSLYSSSKQFSENKTEICTPLFEKQIAIEDVVIKFQFLRDASFSRLNFGLALTSHLQRHHYPCLFIFYSIEHTRRVRQFYTFRPHKS